MTVDTEEFFDTQREPSHVKSAIVSGYFSAWANVMVKKARQPVIGYLDLFAGKGRFDDGSDSTPVLILRKALADPALHTRVRMAFNDKDSSVIASLKAAFGSIADIARMRYPPQFFPHDVSLAIAEYLGDYRTFPTLCFADPFGYMGISLDLLKNLLQHPKSEGIIFFNTNRINAGLSNEFVREHIDALFGPERAQAVREKVARLHGEAREAVILDSFADALKSIGFRYIVRFRFLSRGADRTSHHLIHCSRHPLGEKIMKEIMDAHSVKSLDDVPSFEIQPEKSPQVSLFEGLDPEPPRELADELARSFAGQIITFEDLFRRHSPGKNYVARNYRAALSLLVDDGRIVCDPSANTMRFRSGKRTWPKQTRIIFPPR